MKCKLCQLIVLIVLVVSLVGCAAGPKVRYTDPTKVETLTAEFGSTDLHIIAEKMVNSLVMSPVLDGRPVIFIDAVKNKTHEHIDTKAITDTIRTTLLKHGKAKITGRSDIPESILKEQEFQQSNLADPNTIVKMGKLAGAKFIMFGQITSIVKQDGRKKDVWFKITLNLVNAQDGLIEWADEQQIRKEARKKTVTW